MVSRAQVSLEFLMITGIALVIMLSATFFLFDYTQENSDDNALAQSATVGYRLVDEAANMYVYGEDSFVTVDANLPASVREMYVVENDTLVFELATQNGIVPVQVFSQVPINGTVRDGARVNVSPAGNQVHAGSNAFRVTSQGSWVEIRQVS